MLRRGLNHSFYLIHPNKYENVKIGNDHIKRISSQISAFNLKVCISALSLRSQSLNELRASRVLNNRDFFR